MFFSPQQNTQNRQPITIKRAMEITKPENDWTENKDKNTSSFSISSQPTFAERKHVEDFSLSEDSLIYNSVYRAQTDIAALKQFLKENDIAYTSEPRCCGKPTAFNFAFSKADFMNKLEEIKQAQAQKSNSNIQPEQKTQQ